MADLRALAQDHGLESVRTLGASGNLVFHSDAAPVALERRLEAAIAGHFGFPVDVMVRDAAAWAGYCASNPFIEEAQEKPSHVLLYTGKQSADENMVEALRARALPEEKVARTGDVIWIWFAMGGGRSRLAGGPKPGLWTGRNWRTVVAVDGMVNG